ncbi:MAG TPA: GNAT family N-acetyltransferase [Anaerolineae bacterium]|nr:GNAT family N-acetyltransferase [Anaerolineae bacterium]
MTDGLRLRRATTEDVAAIVRTKRAVWRDEIADESIVATAVSDPRHATVVAVSEDVIVGFVDGFLTFSQSREARWEVDLLAVDQRFRRSGLGERLVRASTEAGHLMGATTARALVRFDNAPCQRLFARCGYRPQDAACCLFVSSDLIVAREYLQRRENVQVIPVGTLNYGGLWLEDGKSGGPADIATGGAWGLFGSVISLKDAEATRAVLAAGFTRIGRYRWWVIETR